MLGADSFFVVLLNSSVLLEISGFNSCDGDLPAGITWLTTGPGCIQKTNQSTCNNCT